MNVGQNYQFSVTGLGSGNCVDYCIIWSTDGGDPASQTGGGYFTTHWDTPGEKTVYVNTPCGYDSKTVTVCDPNTEGCCGGTLYDLDAKKCCTDASTSYLCDSNQTCCKGTCCDSTCEFCCDGGTCCSSTNCEICKNGSCVRAVPTNMREIYWEDLGNGILYFEYAWDSTTGDLADLINCREGECVTYPGGTCCSDNPPAHYYFSPSPPWSGWAYNPTLGDFDARDGYTSDTHYVPGIIKPYSGASVIATQVYQYHCGPDCCMGNVSDRGNWETLLSIGSIQRFVTGGGGLWRYSIIKSGHYAEIFPLP